MIYGLILLISLTKQKCNPKLDKQACEVRKAKVFERISEALFINIMGILPRKMVVLKEYHHLKIQRLFFHALLLTVMTRFGCPATEGKNASQSAKLFDLLGHLHCKLPRRLKNHGK